MMLRVHWLLPENSTLKVEFQIPSHYVFVFQKLNANFFAAEPAILGFTYIDDISLTEKQKQRYQRQPSVREEFLVKTDDEVRSDIFEKLNGLKDPILGKVIRYC